MDEAELESEAPEFARLRKVHRLIEATYGTLRPTAAAVAEVPAREPAPLSTIEAAEPKREVDPGPATSEPAPEFRTFEPTEVVTRRRARPGVPNVSNSTEVVTRGEPDPGVPNVRTHRSRNPWPQPAPEFSRAEGVASDIAAVDELERFGPHAEHLRQLGVFLRATSGTPAELEPRDDPVTRAVEQWTLRLQELARRNDAYLGIDSSRPDPAGPAPVTDGATAGVQDRPP